MRTGLIDLLGIKYPIIQGAMALVSEARLVVAIVNADDTDTEIIGSFYGPADGGIYFHGATEGHKLDNIRVNNKVSFCVVGRTRVVPHKFTSRFESAVVFGRASIVDGLEKREALIELINKYSHGYEKQGENYINRAIRYTCVVKIEIDRLTGKAAM